MCVMIHQSVESVALKMKFELKRVYNVTPTNYLHLVTGYIDLLKEKKKEIGDSSAKLVRAC